MAGAKLIGANYTPPDLVAKVTGRAKYAEDFRADGMLFCKLLLSPMPHARVRRIDASAALAMPGVRAILTADDLPEGGAPANAGPDERAGVRGGADSRRRGRRRNHGRRSDRTDRARPRAAAVRVDPLESPASGQSRTRALDGNVWAPREAAGATWKGRADRMEIRRSSGPTRTSPRPARGSCRWERPPRTWSVRRPRRRVPERRAGGGRNVRRPGHEPSDDGNAQRDGLLAERQAVPVRLDAEHAAHARDGIANWVGIDPSDVVFISEYTGGGFGSKGTRRGLDGDTGAPRAENQRARDDAHQPRGGALHRPRAHEHDRAREGRLPGGRAHPGARLVHPSGQRRSRAARRSPVGRRGDLAHLPAGSDALARHQRLHEHADAPVPAVAGRNAGHRHRGAGDHEGGQAARSSIRSRSARSTRRPGGRRSVRRTSQRHGVRCRRARS